LKSLERRHCGVARQSQKAKTLVRRTPLKRSTPILMILLIIPLIISAHSYCSTLPEPPRNETRLKINIEKFPYREREAFKNEVLRRLNSVKNGIASASRENTDGDSQLQARYKNLTDRADLLLTSQARDWSRTKREMQRDLENLEADASKSSRLGEGRATF
jgi:hypothetical protein